jgi:putative endonuclease
MKFFVYVIGSVNNSKLTTYVGYTNNLLKRIILHNRGKGAKFTRGRKWFLMYYETFKSKSNAMKREYEIKKDKKFREKIKLR